MAERSTGSGLWALVVAGDERPEELTQLLAALRAALGDGILAGTVVVIPASRADLLEAVTHAEMLPLLDPRPSSNLGGALRLGLEFLSDPNLEPGAAAAVIVPADAWVTTGSLARLAARWREGGGNAFRPAGLPAPLLLDREAWPLLTRLQGARAVRALTDVDGFPAVAVPT
jgi:hypothetical protein